MPTGLKRFHQPGDTHFVTFSCFRRKPFLGTPQLRDTFEQVLHETVFDQQTLLQGWVIMPEHVHLLLKPDEQDTTKAVVQILKQRYTRSMKKMDLGLYLKLQHETGHPPPAPVWETRFYDRNIRTPPHTAKPSITSTTIQSNEALPSATKTGSGAATARTPKPPIAATNPAKNEAATHNCKDHDPKGAPFFRSFMRKGGSRHARTAFLVPAEAIFK